MTVGDHVLLPTKKHLVHLKCPNQRTTGTYLNQHGHVRGPEGEALFREGFEVVVQPGPIAHADTVVRVPGLRLLHRDGHRGGGAGNQVLLRDTGEVYRVMCSMDHT